MAVEEVEVVVELVEITTIAILIRVTVGLKIHLNHKVLIPREDSHKAAEGHSEEIRRPVGILARLVTLIFNAQGENKQTL